MNSAPRPPQRVIDQIKACVEKYRRKTGTSAHPDAAVTESVVLGLAQNVDEVGRPLRHCNFHADKQAELADSRRSVRACDEMQRYKYCHCLLFVTPDGRPVTEYLPEGHEGRGIYGLVDYRAPD
ncbi:MAG: ferredoxin:thioredoxin reductase [Planctomycetia bacterium]|nr:ferredoxin:thioredoxin reductase [Planctomycetia bacterium]